jgi:hypothetical protein
LIEFAGHGNSFACDSGFHFSSAFELILRLDDGSRVFLKSHRLRVDVTAEMRTRLEDLLGRGHLHVITAPPAPSKSPTNGGRRSGASRAPAPA